MSDTQQLFILAGVWTVISFLLVHLVPNWIGRIALFALLVGIPFWELPYGYLNFRKLCADEAKLLVFSPIEPQEIVCADYPYVTLHSKLLETGFLNVEVRGKDGTVRRYSKDASGEVSETKQAKLSSEYCLTYVNNNRMPWNVLRHEVLILRVSNGKVAARQSRFDWAGMWWQTMLKPFLGGGGTCADDANRPILAIRYGQS